MRPRWVDDDPGSRETTDPTTIGQRHPRGLLWFWLIGLVLAGALFWLSRAIPALEALIAPVYWVIGITLFAFTLRWFRPRGAERRRAERRHGDKRAGG